MKDFTLDSIDVKTADSWDSSLISFLLDLETLKVEGDTLATISLGDEAILGLEVETVINLFAPNACCMDTASSLSLTFLRR